MYYSDLTDSLNIFNLIKTIQPDEIYNLAAQSHVAVSFEIPEYTANVNAMGTLRILEAIKLSNLQKKTKFYQASTSELFGLIQENPQNEDTRFYPRSPYAISKLFSYWTTINYRESYNIFACNGILFNHESPIRGETFVTKKISQGLVSIAKGEKKYFLLGNLDAKRDWAHAKDYVKAMWMMLQQKKPEDFVIATGKQYSVRDFITTCALSLGIEIKFIGKGLKEKVVVQKILNKKYKFKVGQIIIKVDKKYFRPSEVDYLLGDSQKARRKLNWKPTVDFNSLCKEMINYDLKNSKKLKRNFKI